MDQNEIRRQGLKSRRCLSVSHHEEAAKKLYKNMIQIPELINAQSVGAYIAMADEMTLQPILKWCFERDKTVAVPVIPDKTQSNMHFVAMTHRSNLAPGAFDILEPQAPHDVIDHMILDVVLMPLVAFDKHCNRVGMGGGYYDQTFQKPTSGHRPYLIGCGFDCQKVKHIVPNEWDLQLDCVVTESRVYRP